MRPTFKYAIERAKQRLFALAAAEELAEFLLEHDEAYLGDDFADVVLDADAWAQVVSLARDVLDQICVGLKCDVEGGGDVGAQ